MKICLIVPVYNHEQAISLVLAKLKVYGLTCLLINDGSSSVCSQVLADCVWHESNWITLLNRPQNGGKGAAVIDGLKKSIRLGFTHAIQIDADGQHDFNDIPKFIEASRLNPHAMILGNPLFDETVPKGRLYGRKFTNLWIRINTLSFAISDGMCGFRLYPLAAVEQLSSITHIAKRMDFDIDIVVLLYWQSTEVINLPTTVKYPYDGVSHFKLWRDNLMISKTHARLFFGMLVRIPQLLIRHWR
jgi:glycosyltransferase involved in cell wall biosynthesis